MATTKKTTQVKTGTFANSPVIEDHPTTLTAQQRAGATTKKNVISTGAIAGAIAGSVKDTFANSPKVEDHPATLTDAQRAGAGTKAGSQSKVVQPTVVQPTVTQPTVVSASTSSLNGVSQELYDAMNKKFNVSQAYIDAMNYTNELLAKLSEGKTSYTDQVNEMLQQITNREKFSYDANSDTMFQNYLSGMQSKGQMAMQDTMGQASALTGGYGSTYAQAVGNNAYNSYIQEAYGNMPDYYQLALEAYQAEGTDMYNKLSALSNADQEEYSRLYQSYVANNANAQQQYTNDYNEWMSAIQNAFNLAGMQNSDYWNTQNFLEGQRQFNSELSLNYAKLAQAQSQFNEEMKYKNDALKQDQNQYDTTMAYNLSKASTDKTYSTSDINAFKANALKAYNSDNETEYTAYVNNYLNGLPEDLIDEIDQYVQENGYKSKMERTYTKTDANTYKDQYGNKYSLFDLPEEMRSDLAKLNVGSSYKYQIKGGTRG